MISIGTASLWYTNISVITSYTGGVIGTGLFLGSGVRCLHLLGYWTLTRIHLKEALYNGGPIGALLGYFVIGTVVYCLCVSIGEMIAFL